MRPKLIFNFQLASLKTSFNIYTKEQSQLSIELKFSTFNFQFSIKEDGQENNLENHYPDAGHYPDRYWNYAGRHQLYGAVNEARSPRQHKHEVKTPAASEKNEGRVICFNTMKV